MTAEERNRRTQQKQQSHQRIVEVAARQFREEGLAGAGVQRIMEEAGLTHGGFYSHFSSKDDLVAEAMGEAVAGQIDRLLGDFAEHPESERLDRMVRRYLSRIHRDSPGAGCPLPSISADVARAPDSLRMMYEARLKETIGAIEEGFPGEEGEVAHTRAVGALALCVGGLLLARAVRDTAFSDDILKSCRRFVAETGEREKS